MPDNLTMIYRLSSAVLTFLIIIMLISKSVKFEDLREVLITLPKGNLAFFLGISILISIFKAWRFLILLNNSKINISYWGTLKAFIASQTLTPFPGGEAFRGILVHKQSGTPVVTTAGPVIIQAFLEFFSAGLVVLIGSLFVKELRVPALVAGSLVVVLAYISLHKQTIKILERFLPAIKLIDKILKQLFFVQNQIKKDFFKRGIFVKSFLLSMFNIFLGGYLVYSVAGGYEVDLNFLKSILVYSSSIVIQTLAGFSPGGVGFTEGGMLGILLLFDINLTKALAVVLVFRAVTLVFSFVLGALFLVLFYSSLLIKDRALIK